MCVPWRKGRELSARGVGQGGGGRGSVIRPRRRGPRGCFAYVHYGPVYGTSTLARRQKVEHGHQQGRLQRRWDCGTSSPPVAKGIHGASRCELRNLERLAHHCGVPHRGRLTGEKQHPSRFHVLEVFSHGTDDVPWGGGGSRRPAPWRLAETRRGRRRPGLVPARV